MKLHILHAYNAIIFAKWGSMKKCIYTHGLHRTAADFVCVMYLHDFI